MNGAVYWWCAPGQLPLSDRQRANRQKCARFLADLVAAATLPPHSAHFPLQLLDFAHTWSERGENDIHIFDVLSLAAAVFSFIKTDPGWAYESQYPRPLPELLAAIAELFARRQPHNAPTLQTAWTNQQVSHILEVFNELATPTPAALIDIFERRPCLLEEQQLQLPPEHPCCATNSVTDCAHLTAENCLSSPASSETFARARPLL